MENTGLLKVHFMDFEYAELRDILLDEEVMMRRSTLPDHWFVFIKPERFEKLKLSLLIDRCLVKMPEDSNEVEVSRPGLKLGEQDDTG